MDSHTTEPLEVTFVGQAEEMKDKSSRRRTRESSKGFLRRSVSAACIVTGALLIADGAAAQSAGTSQRSRTPTVGMPESPQVFSTQRKRSSGSFWTPERMRDAEPMDLPLVAPDEAGPMYLPESLPETGRSRREPGAPPSLDVAPDLDNRLFEPREPESRLEPEPAAGADLAPLASAPNGALFTNSRVFPPEAVRAYPYQASGRLFGHNPQNGEFHCSASVIQRRLVVTAGHCVYNAVEGYWYTNFRFIPAYDQGEAPFGAWDFEQAWTTQSWIEGGGLFPNAGDFAILVMTDQFVQDEASAIAEVVGWLGWQTDVVASSHVTILGYPGNLDNGHRMQQTTAQTFALVEPNAAEFGSAHGPGSSGGPYILNFGEVAEGQEEPLQNLVVGIMSYGSTDLTQRRVGTSIINGEFSALVDATCQATRGNCF